MAGARPPAAGPVISRRRLLAGLVLAPPALAACSLDGPAGPVLPDPLIALAAAARTDAGLAASAITSNPALADRVEPLRVARTEHAAALDAAVAPIDPSRAAAPAAASPGPPATLAQLREAVQASAIAAAEVALAAPADRVGLVASVAACCATYAAVLA